LFKRGLTSLDEVNKFACWSKVTNWSYWSWDKPVN
jgi:hypothetical protein